MKIAFSKDEHNHLDSLRGLAAVSVLIVHLGQIYWKNQFINSFRNITDLGKHGVVLFFVLSGYLLATGLNRLENPM